MLRDVVMGIFNLIEKGLRLLIGLWWLIPVVMGLMPVLNWLIKNWNELAVSEIALVIGFMVIVILLSRLGVVIGAKLFGKR